VSDNDPGNDLAAQSDRPDDLDDFRIGDLTPESVEKFLDFQAPRFPLTFSFECYGVAFSVEGMENDEGPALRLSGKLGPLPYSAESVENRRAIGSLLSRAPSYLTARMSLSDSNDIVIEGELPLDGAITPPRIVATATAFVACAKPLIEVIKLAAPGFGSNIRLA
jgi:hypothetical protein